MGYTTEFEGKVKMTPALEPKQAEFIRNFSNTRRMGRDPKDLIHHFKGKKGLPFVFKPTNKLGEEIKDLEEGESKRTAEEIYGEYGGYFVGDSRIGVFDHNRPPGPKIDENLEFSERFSIEDKNRKAGLSQPGLWCQWTTYDGEYLEWDGGEKFYYYVEWLQYMIIRFFEPWGVKLNGEIEWEGEDPSDTGKIIVEDNKINTLEEK